jgi:hypothetical protein
MSWPSSKSKLASSSATTGSAERDVNSLAANTFLTFLIVPKAMPLRMPF